MSVQANYAPGEIVRLGKALYEKDLQAMLESDNAGKYLAVNVETGEWEMGEDHAETILRARNRFPEVGIYGMRIGYRTSEALGGGLKRLGSAGEGNHRL